MNSSNKKRFALGAGAVAAVGSFATLVAGVTFGLFSATTAGQTNTFTAGKVSLTQALTKSCVVTQMSPGDGTAAVGGTPNNIAANGNSHVQCVYDVTYTGDVPAYLGLDIEVIGTAGNTASTNAYAPQGSTAVTGALGLFDGSANGLQLQVKDSANTVTFVNGVTYKTKAGVSTNLTGATGTCQGNGTNTGCSQQGTVNGFLVGSILPNGTNTITVDYVLPTSANNAYQLATSSIKLTIHAVQKDNNPATGCTNGSVCDTLPWS